MTTRWLTDCPESTSAFLPEGVTWKPCDTKTQDAEVQSVLHAFNPGEKAWIAESEDEQDAFSDRIRVLIDAADHSQFDQALAKMKEQDLPDGLICMALTGSGFRGQRKRPWEAVRGNLHLTAHYTLGIPAKDVQASLTMLPAIASVEAIDAHTPHNVQPSLKWVNDVLIQQRKVSGVLTASQMSGACFERAVFGIGVNVAHAPDIQPTPFVPQAGCLFDFMNADERVLPALYREVVQKLDELVMALRTGAYDRIFPRYAKKAGFVGKHVCIWPEGTEEWRDTPCSASGVVSELHEDLSLSIEGVAKPVRSGRMAFKENC